MKREGLDRLERAIGGILRAGVALSASALAIGLLLKAAGVAEPTPILNAGLVLLMLIPVTRILVSFVDALYRRDTLLAIATAIVSAVLTWQLLKVI